jgi:hypothetical protein
MRDSWVTFRSLQQHITTATNNMPEGTVFSSGPKRILVQTKTHLVPGKDFDEKLMFMLDRICQHHWHRKYDFKQDRWSTHGCRFGYPNRTCYFLLDSGESTNDDTVEVLWYLFTGIEEPLWESLCPLWESLCPIAVQLI